MKLSRRFRSVLHWQQWHEYLPTAREGNVFTGVCQSFCPQSASWLLVMARSVRILLECFLFSSVFVNLPYVEHQSDICPGFQNQSRFFAAHDDPQIHIWYHTCPTSLVAAQFPFHIFQHGRVVTSQPFFTIIFFATCYKNRFRHLY